MIRVLIVDDQEMIRVGLRAILAAQPNITVAGEAGDGLEAVRLLGELDVDVVLMDIRMPGVDGVEATRRIRQLFPAERVRIIVLTTFEHDETVFAALRAGANGFLSKGVGPAELAAGIEDVAAGGGALSATAAAALIGRVTDERQPEVDAVLADRFSALTPKEREVVLAIASGLSNQQIAEAMFLSPYTVKTHANRAMTKVMARDRAQLVAFAYRAGLSS
ncbi:LuxR family transcriptional regulator [Arthrobacter sp. ERGS1:01]|uniref:response regulator transcription factor n=1 Tax=Arthrobacter sp. ERGS1:01 TaxID=1704044 RepID=UPI0006B46138|nr:response regulator transcription factor [Arthrobacter sp. ERGS1:01]ALE05748.1 LuxR family transcriptional regulator [Arthrobacter sp. ERGS1:01]